MIAVQVTGIIRRSSDSGDNWSTVYDSGSGTSIIRGIAEAPNGDLYATGGDSSTGEWITVKSTNSGSSWIEVDAYEYPASTTNRGHDVAIDDDV